MELMKNVESEHFASFISEVKLQNVQCSSFSLYFNFVVV